MSKHLLLLPQDSIQYTAFQLNLQHSSCSIHFGQEHDARLAEMMNSMIPEKGVGIMDRGFASWEFLDELSTTKTRFVVRLKNNMKTELDHGRYRVVCFCDLGTHSEFQLATNLHELTAAEIIEVYRHRWQIEILWELLKMHLKLDRLISKYDLLQETLFH